MDIAIARNGENRIICRLVFFSFRKHHTYPGGFIRAVFCRTLSGIGTDAYFHMFVADFRRGCSLCEIFGVNSISSWIVVAYAGYSPFSGFAADLSCFNTVWNGKTGILQTFMYPVHNIAPYILVEGSSAIVHTTML